MLEIFFLFSLWKNLSPVAAAKGRSKAWALIPIGFWIVGEVAGIIIGSLLGLELGAYAIALALAALGATVGWLVVKALPPASGYDAGAF